VASNIRCSLHQQDDNGIYTERKTSLDIQRTKNRHRYHSPGSEPSSDGLKMSSTASSVSLNVSSLASSILSSILRSSFSLQSGHATNYTNGSCDQSPDGSLAPPAAHNHANQDDRFGLDSLAAAAEEVEAVVTILGALRLHTPISLLPRSIEKRTTSHRRPKFLDRGFGRDLRAEGLLGMDLGGALRQRRSNNRRRKRGVGHKLNQTGDR